MSKKSAGESNLFVYLGLLFIALLGVRTISTPLIWTQLAQGRENAPISWLAADNGVNTTWLYDKLAYVVYNMGGASLLIILNIIGLVAAFWLLAQVAKKWGGGLSQGFGLLIAGHLMFQTLDVGPAIPMALFIAVTLYVVSTQKSPAVLFGVLIPVQLLWTNMHGSFLLGPFIAGFAALQVAQNNKGPGSRKKKHDLTPNLMGAVAGAMLVATLVNPSLFKLHSQVIANVMSPIPYYSGSLFAEFFQIPPLKPLMLFVMVVGAAGLITLKKKLPATLTALMILAAFMALTPLANTSSFLIAVIAFPFIVLSLTAISEYLYGSMSTLLGKNDKILVPLTAGVLVLLMVGSLIPVVTNAAYVKTGSASNFGLGMQENQFPQGAEAIINHPAFPEKAINLAADGGYLAFTYDRDCFIDYRPGRYDKELLTDLGNLLLGNKEAYDTLYLEYRPEAFIINTLRPGSAQGVVTLVGRGWKLAYFDGTTAILLTDKPEFADILNNTEAQQAGLQKLEKARADFAAKQGKSSGGNSAEVIGAAKVYLGCNRPEEAKQLFALILQSNLKSPGAWIGLGNSQLLLKEFDAAVASLEIATKQAPGSSLAWRSYAVACKYAGKTDAFNAAIEHLKKIAADAAAEVEKEDVVDDTPVKKKQESVLDMTIPE